MPLLDHFRPPVQGQFPWDSFHTTWAGCIADVLNDQWLSSEFIAAEHTHAGSNLEIDVATFERPSIRPSQPNGPAVTTVAPPTWAAPAAAYTLPAVFPDAFEVRVFATSAGLTLVAVIELISPGNKDRAEKRRAFAAKCASYLHQGVAVVVIDIVTNRRANLHNETMRLMETAEETMLAAEVELYAVAYRPVLRHEKPEIDLWNAPVAVGQPLPTLPLRLTGDTFVPVEFETAYQQARRRRRLA